MFCTELKEDSPDSHTGAYRPKAPRLLTHVILQTENGKMHNFALSRKCSHWIKAGKWKISESTQEITKKSVGTHVMITTLLYLVSSGVIEVGYGLEGSLVELTNINYTFSTQRNFFGDWKYGSQKKISNFLKQKSQYKRHCESCSPICCNDAEHLLFW